MRRPPQIVAFGGGGFSVGPDSTVLDDYVIGLTGVPRPRVCFLPTASGDADHYVVRFYRAFAATRCEPSHISLFRRETGVADPRAHLLSQDLIYVGGGSVVSLLGTWRAHGLDLVLREAWRAGVVLCGGSAGSLCWFAEAISGFHRGAPRTVAGLSLLPWSNAVHYNDEPARRAAFQGAIARGMAPGYGVSDGASLRFVGVELAEVVGCGDDAAAFFVSGDGHGGVAERALPIRQLEHSRFGAEPAQGAGGGEEAVAA
jgi:peptidase E